MNLTLLEAVRLPLGTIDWFPKNGDEDIRSALAILSEVSNQDRQLVAGQLTDGDRQRLDVYAEDVASLAVRLNRLDLVHSGLDALDIAYLGLDWSEAESMPLLFRACEVIGADAKKEFGEAARRLHGVIREAALVYARGDGLSVERTRFVEGHDAEGFRFFNKRHLQR